MEALDKEVELWVSVYTTVINGLFLHDKWNGLERFEARKQADMAVVDFRESFNRKE